ncbi:ACP S-malonyltransferase [Elioraea thermophila]|uniref:ACP S-malonyltransferase n=1 Tax=Elioraea thermophila TaxID=2185104 RepID=UPI000DF177F4|nr:ACP S-malonyltransferase [Elioraea thermophila]
MPVRAFVFPGQGSQAVGMGKELAAAFPVARETFEEVDEALKQNLSRLIFEGPAEELTLTANAQPALMAVSLAVVRVLAREGGLRVAEGCALVAGHSLGEYSALAAADSFTVTEAARLLRLRGEAMQKAVPPGEGAMAALLGIEADEARAVCAEAASGEVVEVANDNGGGQVVISGAAAAVERAIAAAKARGVKRAIPLAVSAPFHCALMAPAAEAMAKALAATPPRPPVVPLVPNVTATPTDDPEEIRDLLIRQVTGTVRWRESVAAMKEAGVDTVVELGAGKVLAGLVKRIDPELTALSVGTPGEIEAFLKTV